METAITPSSLVLLIGAETPDGRLIQEVLRGDGYRIAPLALPITGHLASDEAACLVVAVLTGNRHADRRIISQLKHTPALARVVVGRDLAPPLRALAFAHGAADVIALPMVPIELRTRLRAAIVLS